MLNIISFEFELKFEKGKIKILNESLKSSEIDETKIGHCRSEWNWTKLDETFSSQLLITVTFY